MSAQHSREAAPARTSSARRCAAGEVAPGSMTAMWEAAGELAAASRAWRAASLGKMLVSSVTGSCCCGSLGVVYVDGGVIRSSCAMGRTRGCVGWCRWISSSFIMLGTLWSPARFDCARL